MHTKKTAQFKQEIPVKAAFAAAGSRTVVLPSVCKKTEKNVSFLRHPSSVKCPF